MRSLVTGAAGFVGRHLCDHLSDQGDDVIVPPSRRDGGVDLLDLAGLTRFFKQHRPEVVYHLAGQADVAASWQDPAQTFRTNAEGTLHLLEACKQASVRRVLTVSSAEVYGIADPDMLPLAETAELKPVTPYAASKVAAEYLTIQADLSSDLECLRVRAFNHIGPGQSTNFVAAALASRIVGNERSGETKVPVGDMSARRDFTDVRDVARAYRHVMCKGQAGSVYNVCGGVDHSIQQLADRLAGFATSHMDFVVDESLLRPVDLPALVGDNRQLASDTGWAPEFSFDTTLADVMNDMRDRLDHD